MLDRLMLNEDRIDSMASGLGTVAQLADPLGRVLDEWQRPNGLALSRVTVPLGVIGMIYESRPNVTADAAGLCIKSGNAVILRGGSESFHSNTAIHECIHDALNTAGINSHAVQIVPTTDREAVGYLLSSMADAIDVVIPRGGKNLIRRVQEEARVPVIGHLEGICHVFVHAAATPQMAIDVVVNAKMRRTGICGAAETILIDRNLNGATLKAIVESLQAAGCVVRGDDTIVSINNDVVRASEEDWATEYLDAIVSMRVVDGVEDAIAHIGKYGSGHTDCIVTADDETAELFSIQS